MQILENIRSARNLLTINLKLMTRIRKNQDFKMSRAYRRHVDSALSNSWQIFISAIRLKLEVVGWQFTQVFDRFYEGVDAMVEKTFDKLKTACKSRINGKLRISWK